VNWDDFQNTLIKKEKAEPGYLFRKAEDFISRIQSMKKHAEQFYNKDFSKKTLSELKEAYTKYYQKMVEYISPDYTYMSLNRFLPDWLYVCPFSGCGIESKYHTANQFRRYDYPTNTG